jgi:hypothetical protein
VSCTVTLTRRAFMRSKCSTLLFHFSFEFKMI